MYVSILKGLPHHFQCTSFEFRQLIQKEDSVMRFRDFPRHWKAPPSCQRRIRYRMMRTPKWPGRHQGVSRLKQARNRMHFRCLQGFAERERRQNCRDPARPRGLAGTVLADKKHITAASCSIFQSSLNIRLPAHILTVEHVLPAGLNQRFQIYSYGRLLPMTLEPGDHLRQGFESDDIYPTYNGRLPTVDFRQNNIL